MLSKNERKQLKRQAAARRRMRLHCLIALLIPIMDGWRIGIRGGGLSGKNSEIRYAPVDVTDKEKSYVRMQIGQIDKARDAVVRMLGIASFEQVGQQFYHTADEKLQAVTNAIFKYLPEKSTHTDNLRVLTYIIATAFHDLRLLTDDERPEVKRLCRVLEQFGNHLIPCDSPFLLPMNGVYWSTRDMMQENPAEWYDDGLDWDTGPTEAERWLMAQDAAA